MGEKGDLDVVDGASSDLAEDRLSFAEPAAVERRVWRSLFAVIVIAVIVSAMLADLKFTLGLALGGGLAVFNFKWLHGSLRAILSVGSAKTPPGTAMKFIFRWMVIAAIAYIAIGTGYFEGTAIVAGLFAPAIVAIIEAAYLTWKTIAEDRKGK